MSGGGTMSFVVISGGSGANGFVHAFGKDPAFILPVSDDGGSSSEILRCFGGPSIGDIRSRLIRMIPPPEQSRDPVEAAAVYNLLAYRFPVDAEERIVRDLWHEIVEGRSMLWRGVRDDRKECIRAFLVHFQTLCLRRAHKQFSFKNFSLGNGFLTGARDMFGSLSSAIFLFKSMAGVYESCHVLPAINTNQTVTIAVSLENARTIIGQCEISHPTFSIPPTLPSEPLSRASSARYKQQLTQSRRRTGIRRDSRTFATSETSLPPMSRGINSFEDVRDSIHAMESPTFDEDSRSNLAYVKGETVLPLESPIKRLYYINLYAQEVFPEPNSDVLEQLAKRDVLVYSCGSLWTSIIPCLALRGMATAISRSKSLKAKVLLLNSVNDRETTGYSAADYVNAILRTLKHYDQHVRGRSALGTDNSSQNLITHLIVLEGGEVFVDSNEIQSLGINVVTVPSSVHGYEACTPMFSEESVSWAMGRL